MKIPVPLDPESYDALARLFIPLGKRSCPLYGRVGRRGYDVIGTAVPVRGQKYAALLTASHVIDQFGRRAPETVVVETFPRLV